jgi:uncharacterized protein (DUF302 family)
MNIDKSRAPARSWVKKALCAGAILGLAASMGTQTALANDFEMRPFSRIAKLPVVKVNDVIDYDLTDARAKAAALFLADYVATTVDSGEGGDWVLGGTSFECRENQNCGVYPADPDEIKHAILGIPAPLPINPTVEGSPTKKASVLDFCNKKYAAQALGVKPIIGGTTDTKEDDKYVVNGYSHTPALPCKVSVWNDDKHIYVDMKDPNAIFSLFFTDVHFSEEMTVDTFAKAIRALPRQVKTEIKAIVHDAMLGFAADPTGDFDPNTVELLDKAIGPKYTSMDQVTQAVDDSPEDSPYKHVGYTRKHGGDFDSEDAAAVTQVIINTMSIHGNPDAGMHPAKIKGGKNLESILSPGSSWRSARPTPLPLPGKNYVIEACSPKYAKMAMGTGLHHVTALPCEITVQVIDRTGDGSKETLVVSYLDPHFMLGALFADISEDDVAAFADIPGNIMDDLQKIVAAALDYRYSGIMLNPGVQFSYDMLPDEDMDD